ncbi:hypothetical protein D3C76_713200 [compost metagenome]
MAGLEDVGVLHLRRSQLVVVVRDVQLLLADQLPLVAVRCAVVHVQVVGGTQAVDFRGRAVVGHLRCAAHAALAGVVLPGHARVLDLVEGVMHQQHVAGHAHRLGDARLVVVEEVFRVLRVQVGHALRHCQVFLVAHRGVDAVDLRRGGDRGAQDVHAAEAGDVVPHHFQAVLRNREGDPAAVAEALQAVAAFHQGGLQRAGPGCLVDEVGSRGAAMAGVDHHLVVGVALEQGDLAFGQLVLVLIDVLSGDGEQRLVAGVGVAEEALGVHRGGIGAEAAGPGRDAAVGVAGLFRAQRGQAGAQLGRFIRRDCCHDAASEQGKGEGADEANFLVHAVILAGGQVRSSHRH